MARVLNTNAQPQRISIFDRGQPAKPRMVDPGKRVGGVDLPPGPMLKSAVQTEHNGSFINWGGEMRARGVQLYIESHENGTPALWKGQRTDGGTITNLATGQMDVGASERASGMHAHMQPYQPGIQGDPPHEGSGAGQAYPFQGTTAGPMGAQQYPHGAAPGSPPVMGGKMGRNVPFAAELQAAGIHIGGQADGWIDWSAQMHGDGGSAVRAGQDAVNQGIPVAHMSAPVLAAPTGAPVAKMQDALTNLGALFEDIAAYMRGQKAPPLSPPAAKMHAKADEAPQGRNFGQGAGIYGEETKTEDEDKPEPEEAEKSIDALFDPLRSLMKGGGHKYKSRKKVKGKWVYDYGEKKGGQQASLFGPDVMEKPKKRAPRGASSKTKDPHEKQTTATPTYEPQHSDNSTLRITAAGQGKPFSADRQKAAQAELAKRATAAYNETDRLITSAMRTAGRESDPSGRMGPGRNARKNVNEAVDNAKRSIDILASTGASDHLERLMSDLKRQVRAGGVVGSVQDAIHKHAKSKLDEMKSGQSAKALHDNPAEAADALSKPHYDLAKKHSRELVEGHPGDAYTFAKVRHGIEDSVKTVKEASSLKGAQAYAKNMQRMGEMIRAMGKNADAHGKDKIEGFARQFESAAREVYNHYTSKAKKSMDTDITMTDSAGRVLRKGLHAFRFYGDDKPEMLPEGYLYDYLCAFVEEAYEHEKRESTHRSLTAHDRLDSMACAVMHELVAYLPTNANLRRACEKYACSKDTIARILVEKGLMRPSSDIYQHDDFAGSAAMGAYLTENLELSSKVPWVQAEPAPVVERLLTDRGPGDVSHLVKSDGLDPFQALMARRREEVQGHWTVPELPAGVTASDDCPVHNGRDMTKSMNLWNPMLPCTCSGKANAYG